MFPLSLEKFAECPIVLFQSWLGPPCPGLFREDLWVREGRILDPEKLFFDEKGFADERVDCEGSIVAPGFIDVQINGKLSQTKAMVVCVFLIFIFITLTF